MAAKIGFQYDAAVANPYLETQKTAMDAATAMLQPPVSAGFNKDNLDWILGMTSVQSTGELHMPTVRCPRLSSECSPFANLS